MPNSTTGDTVGFRAKLRHELRTPINHIVGYSEMLQEEALDQVPGEFLTDLRKIHAGGKHLLSLINLFFGSENVEKEKLETHSLLHELRTPVNVIIGYSELLQEQAVDLGRDHFVPDLQKIHTAATRWLGLMEKHLLNPEHPSEQVPASAPSSATPPIKFDVTFRGPTPVIPSPEIYRPRYGSLLVVDDDENNREMLARRLRRQGHTVTIAENGEQALNWMRSERFDLVLLDLIMPGKDGYEVLTELKSDKSLRDIPVIMLSAMDQTDQLVKCILIGAEDYLSKPFNPILLKARIGACLEKKFLRDHEQQTQRQLAAQVAEAAAYVRSILPRPMSGAVSADWCFHPSSQLGGDAFGYHWLDQDHLALYLLDVCGHGVGAALLSVTVMNVLRSQALPSVNFKDPGAVLTGLNQTFKMENQNNMYFTIWYGVYHKPTREIKYSSGGHPPAILLSTAPNGDPHVQPLRTNGLVIGWMDDLTYQTASALIPLDSRLFILSDGVYEVAKDDGKLMSFEDFVKMVVQISCEESTVDPTRFLRAIQNLHGSDSLEDDFSLVQFHF